MGMTWMLLAITAMFAAADEPQFDEQKLLEDGFVPLVNGQDLSGWKVPEGDGGHWKVVDDAIDYDAKSEAKGNKSLFTEQEFGNYVLHLEWRFKRTSGLYPMRIVLPSGDYKLDENGQPITVPTPNADSGILLRGPRHQANLCRLCRYRHKRHYADSRIMPTPMRSRTRDAGNPSTCSWPDAA